MLPVLVEIAHLSMTCVVVVLCDGYFSYWLGLLLRMMYPLLSVLLVMLSSDVSGDFVFAVVSSSFVCGLAAVSVVRGRVMLMMLWNAPHLIRHCHAMTHGLDCWMLWNCGIHHENVPSSHNLSSSFQMQGNLFFALTFQQGALFFHIHCISVARIGWSCMVDWILLLCPFRFSCIQTFSVLRLVLGYIHMMVRGGPMDACSLLTLLLFPVFGGDQFWLLML